MALNSFSLFTFSAPNIINCANSKAICVKHRMFCKWCEWQKVCTPLRVSRDHNAKCQIGPRWETSEGSCHCCCTNNDLANEDGWCLSHLWVVQALPEGEAGTVVALRVDVSQNRYKEGGRLTLRNQLPTAGLTELWEEVEGGGRNERWKGDGRFGVRGTQGHGLVMGGNGEGKKD